MKVGGKMSRRGRRTSYNRRTGNSFGEFIGRLVVFVSGVAAIILMLVIAIQLIRAGFLSVG